MPGRISAAGRRVTHRDGKLDTRAPRGLEMVKHERPSFNEMLVILPL